MKRFLLLGLTALALVSLVGCEWGSPSDPKVPNEYKFKIRLLDGANGSPVVGEDCVAESPDGYPTDHAKTLAPNGETPVIVLQNNGPLDVEHDDVGIRTGGIISGYQRYTGPAHRLEELRDQGRTLYVATVYLTRQ